MTKSPSEGEAPAPDANAVLDAQAQEPSLDGLLARLKRRPWTDADRRNTVEFHRAERAKWKLTKAAKGQEE